MFMIYELVEDYLYSLFRQEELPYRIKKGYNVMTIEEFYDKYVEGAVNHHIVILELDITNNVISIDRPITLEEFKIILEEADEYSYLTIRDMGNGKRGIDYKLSLENKDERRRKYEETLEVKWETIG